MALSNPTSCIREGLEDAYRSGATALFSEYVLLAYYHPSGTYVATLGPALDSQRHEFANEDIVEALGGTGCTTALPFLRRAIDWDPEWDEFHHFKIKCLYAIGEIGGPEAVRLLREAQRSQVDDVRLVAEKEIERLATAG